MARTLERGSEPVQPGRVRLAMVAVALLFALFAGRLFQLQLIEGEELLRRSERNSVRTVRLEAPRGEIVDREGRILATTRPAFGLEVVPDDVRDKGRTFAALGQLLDEEPAELAKAIAQPNRAGRFKPVRLVDDLSPEQLARVEVHRYALAGVATEVEPRRHYLEGDLAAHLLGSLGEIRADQLERDAFDGYRSGDVIGQTGLEAAFESSLRGIAGGRNVVVDVAGREMDVLEEVEPLPGKRVVLALDLDLQRTAEQGLQQVELPNDPRPTGAVAAIDARTGDVLALVSRPAYDPNAFAGRIDSATWKELTTDEWVPLQNRAIQNQFPPGSTFKAFVAAAALHLGVINEQTTVFCPGSFWFGGRSYRCWRRGGHGTVNVHAALRSSCDVFFYTIGVKLGIDRLASFMTTLGLGHPTGIGLAHEAAGVMPSPGVEAEALRRALVPGRDGLGIDRAGLRPHDPAPARGRLCGARERRQGAAPAGCAPGRRAGWPRDRELPAGGASESRDGPAAHGGRDARSRGGRVGAGWHRQPLPCRRCPRRRQDRNVPGGAPRPDARHGRGRDSEALPRPRLVRRRRARRRARDRGGRTGRARASRRDRGGPDRATSAAALLREDRAHRAASAPPAPAGVAPEPGVESEAPEAPPADSPLQAALGGTRAVD